MGRRSPVSRMWRARGRVRAYHDWVGMRSRCAADRRTRSASNSRGNRDPPRTSRNARAEPNVLDRYTRQRRKAQVDFVQAQTIQNKKALEEKDPVIRRRHLDELRRISEDVKLHKQFLYRAALFDSLNSATAVE